MFKGKKIKYKITGPFGSLKEGEVINAILIKEGIDNNVGLVFHPKVKGECPSIEFCRKVGDSDIWVSVSQDNDFGYINVDTKFQANLLGKNFKWKRMYY